MPLHIPSLVISSYCGIQGAGTRDTILLLLEEEEGNAELVSGTSVMQWPGAVAFPYLIFVWFSPTQSGFSMTSVVCSGDVRWY